MLAVDPKRAFAPHCGEPTVEDGITAAEPIGAVRIGYGKGPYRLEHGYGRFRATNALMGGNPRTSRGFRGFGRRKASDLP